MALWITVEEALRVDPRITLSYLEFLSDQKLIGSVVGDSENLYFWDEDLEEIATEMSKTGKPPHDAAYGRWLNGYPV